MRLSIFRILQHHFQTMKYSSYPVQSLNLSNECMMGVEKYVRNVVDDVLSSWSVVIENVFSILWKDTIS